MTRQELIQALLADYKASNAAWTRADTVMLFGRLVGFSDAQLRLLVSQLKGQV